MVSAFQKVDSCWTPKALGLRWYHRSLGGRVTPSRCSPKGSECGPGDTDTSPELWDPSSPRACRLSFGSGWAIGLVENENALGPRGPTRLTPLAGERTSEREARS